MKYPFTASTNSISIFFNGRMNSVPQSDPNFAALYDHLKLDDHDFEYIEKMIDKPKMIARLSEGLVTVVGSTVYYKSEPVNSTLTLKLLQMLEEGFDCKPWARFLERVMANPSERSRQCLFDFLNHWMAPITEDGYFLAFKRIRPDYLDMHTGTFDNSPGNYVAIPREQVDPDPDKTCSRGLHVAASSYLGHFASTQNSRTVVCKVDPADVVAVPKDYGFAKMRVCAYLVLGDAEESEIPLIEGAVVSFYGTDDYADAGDDFGFDDGDWDEDDDDDLGEDDDGDDNFDDDTDILSDVYDDADAEDPNTDATANGEIAFTRDGVTVTAAELLDDIKQYGQRGYSRLTGIPRTTLQDWLSRL
jgi:hypothetical protein